MAKGDLNLLAHHVILGLPTDQKGVALSPEDIQVAYNNVKAEKFQIFISSYNLLEDPEARKLFDKLVYTLLAYRDAVRSHEAEVEEFVVKEMERWRREEEAASGKKGLKTDNFLKVSWEREGGDYSAETLVELFGRFGEVEDVVVRVTPSREKAIALVNVSTKDAVVAAAQSVRGNPANPLLVVPSPTCVDAEFPSRL